MAIDYVKEQTHNLCLIAVGINGLALQYVRNQTPDICMTAVKQNGKALQNVKNQTLDMCIDAVKQDNKNLDYVNTNIIIKKMLESTNKVIFEDVTNGKFTIIDQQTDLPTTVFNYIETIYGTESKNYAMNIYNNKIMQSSVLADNNFSGVYVMQVNNKLCELYHKIIEKSTNRGWVYNSTNVNVKNEKIGKFIITD